MGNRKLATSQWAAGAESRPTIRQAAARLVEALDLLTAEQPGGFNGWESADGAPAGAAVEEARHELKVLLSRASALSSPITGAAIDPEMFELVWKSDRVQEAGRAYGWRGVAEVVWATALQLRHDDSATSESN